MKKLFSIFFLTLLLFNFYGYSLLIDYMQQKAEATVQSKLEQEEYNEDELILIKTPINLPYYSNSETFEKVYGSVEVNGIVYNYVKRRVYQGNMELLCLPDYSKQHLQLLKNDFVRLSLDATPAQQNQKAPAIVKLLLPDYCQEVLTYSLKKISQQRITYYSADQNFTASDFSRIGDQPPESMQLT